MAETTGELSGELEAGQRVTNERLAELTARAIEIDKPAPAQAVEYSIGADEVVKFNFSLDDVEILQTDTDIILVFEDEAQISFPSFVASALAEVPPLLLLPNGVVISAPELLELGGSITDVAQGLGDLDPAAGGAADTGTVSAFAGPLFDDGLQIGNDIPVSFVAGGPLGLEGVPAPVPPPLPDDPEDDLLAPPPVAALAEDGTIGAIPPIAATAIPDGDGFIDTIPEIPPLGPFGLEEEGLIQADSVSVRGDVPVDFFENGPAAENPLVFTQAGVGEIDDLELTSRGEPVSLVLGESGDRVDAFAGDELVFSISVTQGEGGEFEFVLEQLRALDHGEGPLSLPFEVEATDSDGSTVTQNLDVTITDAGPVIAGIVSDSLNEGNLAGSEVTAVRGDIPVTFSEDGPASDSPLVFTQASVDALEGQLTSQGEGVTFTLSEDGTRIEGTSVGGETVLTVALTQDGGTFGYTLTQQRALDHGEELLSLSFGVEATDGDGSTATQTFDVGITDAGPAIPDVADGTVGEGGLADGEAVTVSRELPVSFNGDGPADVDPVVFTQASVDVLNGLELTSQGARVTVSLEDDGRIGATADGETVFTVEITQSGEDFGYTLTQQRALDHGEELLSLSFGVEATDSDGSVATQGFDVTITDAGPSVSDISDAAVDEGAIAGGDPVTVTNEIPVSFGGDGPADANPVVFTEASVDALNGLGLTSQGEDVAFARSDDGAQIVATAGGETVLAIDITQNGDDFGYTFTQARALDHGGDPLNLSFGVEATDGDGSTATQTFDVRIVDGVPVLTVDAEGSGVEDIPVPLNLDVVLESVDGPDAASVTLSGVPEGVEVIGGNDTGNGVWEIPAENLDSVSLATPPHFSGEIPLTLTANATDTDGDTASVTHQFTVTVDPDADDIDAEVSAGDATFVVPEGGDTYGTPQDDDIAGSDEADTISGGAGNDEISGLGGDDTLFGDSEVPGEYRAPLNISVSTADEDGSERQTVEILGVPRGVSLSNEGGAVRPDEDGRYILDVELQQLADLAVSVPQGTPDFELGFVFNNIDTAELNGETVTDELSATRTLTVQLPSASLTFDDTIRGGDGDDTIFGQQGDDVLYGDAGSDEIHGEDGADTVNGGDGDDTIFGQDGRDVLSGNAGDDTISGGEGFDQIFGGEGSDVIHGDAASDKLYGGAGDDVIRGGDGNDLVVGNDGDDVLFGNAGNDALRGNDGDDTLDGGSGRDTIAGGDGNDIVSGGDGDDRITGGDGQDVINGDAGNDTIFGQQGDDVLNGDGGSDTISGGIGDDVIHGGEGDDLIVGGSDSGVTAPVRATFTMTGSNAGYNNSFGYFVANENGEPETGKVIWANVKANRGEEVTVEFDDLGDPPPQNIGLFIIPNGERQNPGLEDGTAVTFRQIDGQWVAHTNEGQNPLSGENGDAAYFSDPVLNPDGTDDISDPVHFRFNDDGTVGIEDLPEGGGSDHDFNDVEIARVVESEAGFGDTLSGGDGDDTIYGDSDNGLSDIVGGNDLIDGGAGDDRIFGQLGEDVIDGGSGNDNIEGGDGRDWIAGGTDRGTITINQPEIGDLSTGESGDPGFPSSFGYYVTDESGVVPTSGKIIWANVQHNDETPFSLSEITDGLEDGQEFGFFVIPNGFAQNKDEVSDGVDVTFAKDGDQYRAFVDDEPLGGQGGNPKGGPGNPDNAAYFSGAASVEEDGTFTFADASNINPDGEVHVRVNEDGSIGFEDGEIQNSNQNNDFDDVVLDFGAAPTAPDLTEGDILTGGDGADAFYYNRGDGVDTIKDFEIGEDRLIINGYERGELSLFQDGEDTVVQLGDDGAIKLQGVNADDLRDDGAIADYGVEDADEDGTLSIDELVELQGDILGDGGGSDGETPPPADEASIVLVTPSEPGLIDSGGEEPPVS